MLLPLGVVLLGVIAVPLAFAETYEEHIIEPVVTFGYSGCQDKDGCYDPVTTHAGQGDVIVFSNTDFAAHTFTSGTPDGGPDGIFDSGLKLPRYSFQWQADTAGEIPYFCTVHNWMTGVIIVEDQTKPEISPMPEDDHEDLSSIIEQLVGLVDDLKAQVASLEARMVSFEDRIATLEANNSDTGPEPEQPEPEQPKLAAITGTAFDDANGNGVQDVDESGIETAISLMNDSTSSTMTDTGGTYTFGDLSPGVYTITVTIPEGYTASVPTIMFILVEGETVTINFALEPEPESEIPERPQGLTTFITTDKTAYSLGDTIKVTGFIDPLILRETVSDERLGTTIVHPKFIQVAIFIDAQNNDFILDLYCVLPIEERALNYPDLELGTFYVFRDADGNHVLNQGNECFDASGNFNFDFVVNEDYYIDSYVARLYAYNPYRIFESTPLDDTSSPFTVS